MTARTLPHIGTLRDNYLFCLTVPQLCVSREVTG